MASRVGAGLAAAFYSVDAMDGLDLEKQKKAKKDYELSFNNLKDHLNKIVNYQLLNVLKIKIEDICKNPIDPLDGIIKNFDDLVLPEDTKRYLDVFNANIITYLRFPKVAEKIVQIKKDLGSNTEIFQKEFLKWPDLDYLFSCKFMMGISNENVIKIIEKINQEDIEALIDLMKEILKDEISKIDTDLTSTKYKSLRILLRKVIQNKLRLDKFTKLTFFLASSLCKKDNVSDAIEVYKKLSELFYLKNNIQDLSKCIRKIKKADPNLDRFTPDEKMAFWAKSYIVNLNTKLEEAKKDFAQYKKERIEDIEKRLTGVIEDDLGHSEVIKALVKAGAKADVNLKDKYGWTIVINPGEKNEINKFLGYFLLFLGSWLSLSGLGGRPGLIIDRCWPWPFNP